MAALHRQHCFAQSCWILGTIYIAVKLCKHMLPSGLLNLAKQCVLYFSFCLSYMEHKPQSTVCCIGNEFRTLFFERK